MRGERLVTMALEHAGLVPVIAAEGAAALPIHSRASVRRAVAGLAVLGCFAIASGVGLQATAHREGQNAGVAPLELVPAAAGFLHVLATPWADVWVDGQHVETTPFARAIPLSPGTHYVMLVHPDAPTEKRVIAVTAGETRTLDVVMAVTDPSSTDEAGPQTSAERSKR